MVIEMMMANGRFLQQDEQLPFNSKRIRYHSMRFKIKMFFLDLMIVYGHKYHMSKLKVDLMVNLRTTRPPQ